MSVDTHRAEIFSLSVRADGMPHARAHSMWHAPCFWHALARMLFVFMPHGMRHGLCASFPENRRFRRFSGKRSKRPPTVAVTHAQHECIIVHAMTDMHVACHAVRAHTKVTRGRAHAHACVIVCAHVCSRACWSSLRSSLRSRRGCQGAIFSVCAIGAADAVSAAVKMKHACFQ